MKLLLSDAKSGEQIFRPKCTDQFHTVEKCWIQTSSLCGKRTDFGYDEDFDGRYMIGKLLGHGQFGYTYVATDKSSGDRVAVKRIEKNKGGLLSKLKRVRPES